MSEPVVKRLQVTFNDGLPIGKHATFRLDGELWIAYPQTKNRNLHAAVDRLIAVCRRTQRHLSQWIAQHPDDADRLAFGLKTLATVDEITTQTTQDKTPRELEKVETP